LSPVIRMKKHRPRSSCGEETKTEIFSTVVETPSCETEAGTEPIPVFRAAAEASNERAKGSVRKILKHFVAKEGKDPELCEGTKIKLVLQGDLAMHTIEKLLAFERPESHIEMIFRAAMPDRDGDSKGHDVQWRRRIILHLVFAECAG
jgi:hypothetical protein